MTLRLGLDHLSLKKGYNLLVHDLSFVMAAGEAVSLTGDNGVGKTTLLRTLAGFIAPHAGEVFIERDDARLEMPDAQSRLIHYLGHTESLSPTRTAIQELRFQSEWLGGDAARLETAIARLKLGNLLDLETRYLSAGQKRRLSVARLLIAPRPVWCLDEPMAPLDMGHRVQLSELMSEHVASGGILICAVHDPLPFETRSLHLTRPTVIDNEVPFV
jgi:heme exporter protein A